MIAKRVTRLLLFLFLFIFMVQAQADKLTKMQKVRHASPMPNLMMLITLNANALQLDNKQLEATRKWRSNNQQASQNLVNEIINLEKEIKQSVLDGIDKAEMDQLRKELLGLRGKLMDLKYRCLSNMTKTLNEQQWQKLMEIRERSLRVTSSGKKAGNEIQAFLRVSPMPKLMAVILMHKKELSLTIEQNKSLEKWRLKSMNSWAILFDQVLSSEKKITQQALAMKSNSSLMKQFDEMAKKRREMAQMSLNCRDNMQKVLSKKQWQQVVKLLKSYI